ncbi:MAG TPA: ABC transporter permease [Thermomicrobiales bacterium]|nr:ABC transporter permease [Thermomicrobiales bacterium]
MRYWLNRLLETIPLLIGVSVLTFLIFRAAPGDPVALVMDPTMVSEADREAVREDLGLNKPLPVQYVSMMTGMVSGDLRSFKSKQPTMEIVAEALPITLIVGGAGLLLGLLVAFPLGTLAARKPGGWVDRFVSVSMTTSLAIPPFVLGLVLILFFTERWGMLPGSGIAPIGTVGFAGLDSVPYLVMPIAVVAFSPATILARYLRDALGSVLRDDYVRTARAKGLSEPVVLSRHAIRNAMLPVVSLLTTLIPVTLGGSVIVETLFGLPGLGTVTTRAALSRDYPVVMTTVLFVAVLTVMTNLIIDLIYGWIDPRIRVQ